MASIEKRSNGSYRIVAFDGCDINGKKIRYYDTVTATELKGLTERQKQNELERRKVQFEQKIKNSGYLDGEKARLADFIDRWLVDYAEKQLAPKTVERYLVLIKRIKMALGHIKLSKLQPTHIISFYNNLQEGGIRNDYKYRLNEQFYPLMQENKKELTISGVVNSKTINGLLKGGSTTTVIAVRLAEHFKIPVDTMFTPIDKNKGLSSQTILHHHRLLYTILETAMHWQLINSNPAARVDPPKVERKEAAYLNDKQVTVMLQLLEKEPLKYQVAVYIAVLGGLRLGEVVGLTWDDIDFESGKLSISQASQYTKTLGNYKKLPKNATSKRILKLPQIAVNKLKSLWKEQLAERLKCGNLWVNTNNVLIQNNGAVMFPTTPTHWFKNWIKKTDLPPITFHQLRHTNASILIASGVDVVTVSKRLGHAKPSTTTDIYSHIINRVDESAAAILDDIYGNISSN